MTWPPGRISELTFTVVEERRARHHLEPYLGAFGHLVALRDGDLAFLHVHPEGDEPTAGRHRRARCRVRRRAAHPGRYLLYLDFQVDGKVHSAPFVVDTTGTATGDERDSTTRTPTPSRHRADTSTARPALSRHAHDR